MYKLNRRQAFQTAAAAVLLGAAGGAKVLAADYFLPYRVRAANMGGFVNRVRSMLRRRQAKKNFTVKSINGVAPDRGGNFQIVWPE